MRFKWLLVFSLLLVLPGGISCAQEARQVIPKDKTNEPIQVHLAPGFGVNLSFVNSQEIVEKVWLDNPAFVTVSADGCLHGLGQNCSSLGAKILHLRLIEPLNLEGIPKSQKTLLTVIARDRRNNPQLYLFTIQPASSPQILVFEIQAEQPKKTVAKSPQVDYFLLAAVERGIQVSLRNGWLEPRSELTHNLRQFSSLLAKGYREEDAASLAGISLLLLNRLKDLGGYLDVPQILLQPSVTKIPTQSQPQSVEVNLFSTQE